MEQKKSFNFSVQFLAIEIWFNTLNGKGEIKHVR